MEKNRQIKVDGMTCTNCSLSVRKKLEKMGLQNIKVDFLSGEASFDGDVAFERVSEELSKIGYTAREELVQESTVWWKSIEFKLIISSILTLPLLAHMFLPHQHLFNHPIFQMVVSLPVTVIGLLHFGKSAWGSLRSGIANMDVLIFIGAAAAFSYSVWGTWLHYGSHDVHNYLFFETSATIITLVLLGNFIEQRTVNQTTSALQELLKLQKVTARRIIPDSRDERFEEIEAEQIREGDVLLINSGDRVAVDGEILSGECHADESMISGESLPLSKAPGDQLLGGTLLVSGNVKMKAVKVGRETTLSGIIALVKEAQLQKPSIQLLGDRISAVFVPAVVAIAVLTFLISYFATDLTSGQSLMNAVAVLVISCPCAMGLATPTALAAGIGRAASNGILFKGNDTIERLSQVRTVIFDKTGTLTTGDFSVREIIIENEISEAEILAVVAGLEKHSSHPIAKSLSASLAEIRSTVFVSVQEIKGKGLSGTDENGITWKFGSPEINGAYTSEKPGLHLFRNDIPVARIMVGDTLREGAKEMITQLQSDGFRVVLLSGDHKENCRKMAEELGITEWYARQLPEEKLEKIHQFRMQGACAMVGDGINDAPALAASDIGISLGGSTQIAMHSAQVILLHSDLRKIPFLLKLTASTFSTIRQNLFWAFFYNVIAIPFAALGFLNPMIAALSMAFSDVMVVGNSIRLKFRKLS